MGQMLANGTSPECQVGSSWDKGHVPILYSSMALWLFLEKSKLLIQKPGSWSVGYYNSSGGYSANTDSSFNHQKFTRQKSRFWTQISKSQSIFVNRIIANKQTEHLKIHLIIVCKYMKQVHHPSPTLSILRLLHDSRLLIATQWMISSEMLGYL